MTTLLFLLGATWAAALMLLMAVLSTWVFLTTKSLGNAILALPTGRPPGHPDVVLSPGQTQLRRIADSARRGLAGYVAFVVIPLYLYTFFVES